MTCQGPIKDGLRSRGGFTLIELLVVISIISLLIAIILPALSSAREQGKFTKCLANMRSAGQAATNHMADTGRFPLVTDEVGVEKADPSRRTFHYTAEGELFSWPAALAKASSISIDQNWQWGVRAGSYSQAISKKGLIDKKLAMKWLICPSDTVNIASPYYPRNKPNTINGIDNNGLKSPPDPDDPGGGGGANTAYYGNLSYAVNEDLTGAEVAESNGNRACWRSINGTGCRGEFGYPPTSPCGSGHKGWRLQGALDRTMGPSEVGLIFEAGRDDENANITGFANLIISALANGPFLGDFQQFHNARMPTNRHPKGKMNILYADIHGGSVKPAKFGSNGLPSEYAPRVRVSPYY